MFDLACSGCLAQYVGDLDGPWTNVAEALEKLWHHSIITEYGIEETIKDLSIKLSEAIMYAMDNGPKVEAKVSDFIILFVVRCLTFEIK